MCGCKPCEFPVTGKFSIPHSAIIMLVPIPAHPHVTAAALVPPAWSPHRPGTRRKHPASVHPHPSTVVPGPTAGCPHKPRPGGHWPELSSHRRRTPGRPTPAHGTYHRRSSPSPTTSPAPARLGIYVKNPCDQHADNHQNNRFFPFHIQSSRPNPSCNVTRSPKSSTALMSKSTRRECARINANLNSEF
jgi:hypothetical protein